MRWFCGFMCGYILLFKSVFLRHSLKIAVKMFKTLDNLKQFEVRRRSRHIYVLSTLTKGRILNTVAMLFTRWFIFYVPNNCILHPLILHNWITSSVFSVRAEGKEEDAPSWPHPADWDLLGQVTTIPAPWLPNHHWHFPQFITSFPGFWWCTQNWVNSHVFAKWLHEFLKIEKIILDP